MNFSSLIVFFIILIGLNDFFKIFHMTDLFIFLEIEKMSTDQITFHFSFRLLRSSEVQSSVSKLFSDHSSICHREWQSLTVDDHHLIVSSGEIVVD